MKVWKIFAMSLLILGPALAQADIGLGIILGAPTGFSGILSDDKAHAFDGAVAWDMNDDHFHVHGDYLWMKRNGLRLDRVSLDWYFGLGGRLVLFDKAHHDDHDFSLGVRGPIGLSYTFRDPRIELFGELALIMDFIEETDADLDAGIGARYHF